MTTTQVGETRGNKWTSFTFCARICCKRMSMGTAISDSWNLRLYLTTAEMINCIDSYMMSLPSLVLFNCSFCAPEWSWISWILKILVLSEEEKALVQMMLTAREKAVSDAQQCIKAAEQKSEHAVVVVNNAKERSIAAKEGAATKRAVAMAKVRTL